MSNLKLFNETITTPKVQSYLASVLGDSLRQFVTNCVALVANDKNLQECEPVSIINAAIAVTSIGLSLNPTLSQAYVIPFRNNKEGKVEATLQLGWKGYQQLAIRSGQFRTINVSDVRRGEIKSIDRLTGEASFSWIDDETQREQTEVIGYVGYFELLNGYRKTQYWPLAKIKEHATKYSQTFRRGFGVWKDNFDAMAKKTVIKRLLASGDAPLSFELQSAINQDSAIIRDGGKTIEYVDNQPKTVSDEADEYFEAEVVEENQGKEADNVAE